jgi:uncharacterized membrane protein YGL010W
MSQKLNFHEYMRAYAEDHRHPVNKAFHMIGIPLIVASVPVSAVAPRLGAKLFGLGWAFQFAGHYIEGKKPSFTRDPRYLAIGPVWVAVAWAELLTRRKWYVPPPGTSSDPVENAAIPGPAGPQTAWN